MKNCLVQSERIVMFTLDEPRYALYLSAVERIVRAVEITPLPKATEIVSGVINSLES
jgi:purine-binding chemotaxis protein CheW